MIIGWSFRVLFASLCLKAMDSKKVVLVSSRNTWCKHWHVETTSSSSSSSCCCCNYLFISVLCHWLFSTRNPRVHVFVGSTGRVWTTSLASIGSRWTVYRERCSRPIRCQQTYDKYKVHSFGNSCSVSKFWCMFSLDKKSHTIHGTGVFTYI